MVTVLGVFSEQSRALDLIEALRGARFDTQQVRLLGGPDDVADFAARVGASADIAAGPPDPLLRGLVGTSIPENDLQAIEQRIQDGAAVVFANDLDTEKAAELRDHLQAHHAEQVITSEGAR
jgi:hypothetical protein